MEMQMNGMAWKNQAINELIEINRIQHSGRDRNGTERR